jgi:hypothetical protein
VPRQGSRSQQGTLRSGASPASPHVQAGLPDRGISLPSGAGKGPTHGPRTHPSGPTCVNVQEAAFPIRHRADVGIAGVEHQVQQVWEGGGAVVGRPGLGQGSRRTLSLRLHAELVAKQA